MIEQIRENLKDKKNILLVFPEKPNHDTIAGASALSLFLKKIKKNVDVINENFECPPQLKFLKEATNFKQEIEDLRPCVIHLNTNENGVKQVEYDLQEKELRIFITPKKGSFRNEHIEIKTVNFKYDLIISLGAPDLQKLGNIFRNNTKLFFNTPLFNIDCSPENENFGHINFVNITATSVCETLYLLINKLAEEHLDQEIANALLLGMIANTNSFQSAQTKPRTLLIASRLINLGANRQQIIQSLYKSRKLSTLKLWGAVLSKLQNDPKIGFVWSALTREDFIRSNATEKDLEDIFDDLIMYSPDAKIVLLTFEDINKNKDNIHGILRVTKHLDAKMLVNKYRPYGNNKQCFFTVKNKNLIEVTSEVKKDIRKIII
jgi:nanoRNase/pAp phosphatase (c-di-AMP/oligoRNAs hydrolase)